MLKPFIARHNYIIWAFVGIFVSSSVNAMDATAETDEQKVTRIITTIRAVDTKIQQDANGFVRDGLQIDEYVIVNGNSGDGKSSLLNFIGKKPLRIIRDRGLKIETEGPSIPGIEIGHNTASQTSIPYFWYDPTTRRIYYDSPGVKDTRKPENDICNAYAIHKLFCTFSPAKVILVVGEESVKFRGQNFQDHLKILGDFFRDDIDRFALASCLILTRRDELTIQEIRTTLTELSADLQLDFSERSRALIRGIQNQPIAFFPKPHVQPTDTLPLPFLPLTSVDGRTTMDGILNTIQAIARQNNIRSIPTVCPNSQRFAQRIAGVLNTELRDYLHTTVVPAIYQYCDGRIDGHNGTALAIRTDFATMARNLDLNPGNILPPTLNVFTQRLQQFLQTYALGGHYDRVREYIGHISFLKQLNDDINHACAEWIHVFQPVRSDIEALSTIHNQAGSSDISGFLIGISDAVNLIATGRVINIFALNTLYMDASIVHHGTFANPGIGVSCIAPHINVIGPRSIDVRGEHQLIPGGIGNPGTQGTPGRPAHPGTNGGDGQPGLAGGNGGHLYLKADRCTNPHNLTVDTSAGNGSNGGGGGNGANAVNGTDGDLNTASRTENNVHFFRYGHEINGNVPQRWRDFNNIPGFMDFLEGPSSQQPFPINELNNILDQTPMGVGIELVKQFNRQVRQRDIWHHQFNLWGNKEYFERQGSDAAPPTNGGRGGAGGLRGHPGQFIIHIPNTNFNNWTHGAGNNGNPGQHGTGGLADGVRYGRHGSNCDGVIFTHVRSSNGGEHQLGTWTGTPGRAKRHIARGGIATPGQGGAAVNINGQQTPNANVPAQINIVTTVQAYNVLYDAQFSMPHRNHFLRDFQNRH
jgi:hypothetical protein